jgi:hypothetical protein
MLISPKASVTLSSIPLAQQKQRGKAIILSLYCFNHRELPIQQQIYAACEPILR